MEVVRNDAGEIVKAGTVVFNDAGQILLVHDSNHPRWSLPKGHVEPGEDIAAAAVRETEEETGMKVELLKKLGDLHYVGAHLPARLHLWAARVVSTGGPADVEWAWKDSEQADQLLWPEVTNFLRAQQLIEHSAV